jgi:ADP-ribose pyrophosphatase YjhB (NUDIX family)
MVKICDHTSVGMLVWRDDRLLLIERARGSVGFALPAGHVDGDVTYEDAARRELKEEVGLDAHDIELVAEGRRENPCRRDDGTWHYWKLFQVTAHGEMTRSLDETKRAGWYSVDQIQQLAERTKKYISKEISEDEWTSSPGLELVMYEWFQELTIST